MLEGGGVGGRGGYYDCSAEEDHDHHLLQMKIDSLQLTAYEEDPRNGTHQSRIMIFDESR